MVVYYIQERYSVEPESDYSLNVVMVSISEEQLNHMVKTRPENRKFKSIVHWVEERFELYIGGNVQSAVLGLFLASSTVEKTGRERVTSICNQVGWVIQQKNEYGGTVDFQLLWCLV